MSPADGRRLQDIKDEFPAGLRALTFLSKAVVVLLGNTAVLKPPHKGS